jgi:hypothetical protein
MKFLRSLPLLLVAAALPLCAQTPLTQTTLSAAITSGQTQITVASATGVTATSTLLFVDKEALFVEAANGTVLTVQRGASGTRASQHVSGAGVLLGPPNAFVSVDPQGQCTAGSGVFQYKPVVNVTNGLEWLCSINGNVAPGFGNTSAQPNTTAAVASAAGAILPSGPLFHVTGTSAITGFTLPVGFDPAAGGTITIVADAVFTWTAAGNISVASATTNVLTGGVVVVGKAYVFNYDPHTSKFYVQGS